MEGVLRSDRDLVKHGGAELLGVRQWRFPGRTISVPASKLFTHPTRLSAAWQARVMEVSLPGYELERPEVHVSVTAGSTRSLRLRAPSLRRRVHRLLRSAVRIDVGVIHDARYESDANIAHIIENVAPKLLLVGELRRHITVVLRSNASQVGRNAYETLGFGVLCTDRDVEGNLLVASNGDNGAYEPWNGSVFPGVPLDWSGETPARVFIARRGPRRLSNEDEIEAVLRGYGFTRMYFEDLSVAAQWSIARNARIIVGIHGAAMSSVVFNDSGVKVIELFHPGYVVDSMRHKVAANGGVWCGVTGRLSPEVIRELDDRHRARAFARAPISIDPGSLRMALDYVGGM